MTKDEEKAQHDDNIHFVYDEDELAKDMTWFICIAAICAILLIGLWAGEVWMMA